MSEKPEKREIREHVLKQREIYKMPGEREKVDESGSLSEKPGEPAGLHQWTANGYLLRKEG